MTRSASFLPVAATCCAILRHGVYERQAYSYLDLSVEAYFVANECTIPTAIKGIKAGGLWRDEFPG
jgi:hypothetical protein